MKKEIKTGNVVPRGYIGVVKVKETVYPSNYCGYYGIICDGCFKGEARHFVLIDIYETYEEAINGDGAGITIQAEEDCLIPVMQINKNNNYW